MTETPPAPHTFADHVVDYATAGWPCILPVPPATKTPPPAGYTGAEGRDTDPLTLVHLATAYPGYSIALRMPDGVIGIDVDDYWKHDALKQGAATIAAYAAKWGPLPPTWTSTARGVGLSRIHFYRVPQQRYATRLATETTGDVEIIQRHHRYAVVWPSVHPDAGTYTWYATDGSESLRPPSPGELTELPAAWVAGLADGAANAAATSSDATSGQALLDQLTGDWRPECAEITSARLTAVELIGRSETGSRHDVMTERTHHLVQLAASGHAGVAAALTEIRELWERVTAGEDRPGELDRALLTSARKAVTVVGAVQVPNDPCLTAQGYAVALPTPSDARPAEEQAQQAATTAPVHYWSPREVLGADAFDPNADLDQTLAEAVLARVWPGLRFAYDSGRWLRRGPEVWEALDDQTQWAVAQVASLMPVGDPTAEKGSDQHARSARRARLMTASGAGAVSAKMRALTAGGYHPNTLRAADLDTDPDLLWAGGFAWDLRRSSDGPTFAMVDPSLPHLKSALTMPERRLTPLWDAFLAAVWPDESVRRWALRVLSVAVTGHSARIMPILLGDGGRGKTQTVELIMSVLGSYAVRADTRLLRNPETAHASIVYALKDHRIAFIDEGPPEGRWAQERLKDLTGGGSQTANQMHQNPITFRPTHTLVLAANEEPILVDAAVRSRARLIPCEGDPDQVAAARAAIGNVHSGAWLAEAPGVLAQLMAEAAGWLHDPSSAGQLAAPEHIRYLAETISVEQDPIRLWLEDETEPFEQGTSSRELYQHFRASCQRSGIRGDLIPTETKWGRALTRLGYPSVHTNHGKRRLLRLRMGGFSASITPVPPLQTVTGSDGLTPKSDGLVTGSEQTRHLQNARSDSVSSVDGDGLTGLQEPFPYTHTRTHAREGGTRATRQPVTGSVAENPVSAGQPQEVCSEPNPSRARQTDTARQKAAEVREAKRREAIEAASGPLVDLPAVVTRDGTVTPADAAVAAALLAPMLDHAVTVDVEHTGYPIGHRLYALRTVQLGNDALAVDFDPAEPEQRAVIADVLARARKLHAHSATADLVPLEVDGLLAHGIEEAWTRMHDTVIPAKLADPASTGADPDLKQLAAHVLRDAAVAPRADKLRGELFKAGKWLTKTTATTPIQRSGWAQVDPRSTTMVRYAAADVLDDAAIAKLLPVIPAELLERERLAQRMTARIAHRGLRLDGEHIEAMLPVQRAALADAAERLTAYGVANPGSDQQVAAVAQQLGAQLPLTPTGRASVAKGALELYARLEGQLGDFVRARLDYQKAETALGLFLEPYQMLVQHGDGRARPTVYTLSADTGRMSCVRPNLQQMPREGGFRACITADPGYVLISADFASVEIRVAAALSQDPSLIAILAEADANPETKNDLHWRIARLAFGPDATKADRYMAKRKVFGRIYGQGLDGMARTDGAGIEVARAVISAMDAMTPGLTAWSEQIRNDVRAGLTGFQTYSGRVVHLDPALPHKAPNYEIQGTARELLVDALIGWDRTRWRDAVILPVHDEVVAMVPEDEAEAAQAALVACMTSTLSGIPIVGEASEPSYAWKDSV